MTENHFRSDISPAAILDPDFCQNRCGPPSIVGQWLHQYMKLIGAFLIKVWSAQAFSSYFHKLAAGGHLGYSEYLQNR